MFRRRQWRQAVTPIALAFVSVLAAIALWVAVTESENPQTIQELELTVPVETVNVRSGLATASISPQGIALTRVSATQDAFEQLTAANFRATVDMTGATAGTSTQIVTVSVQNIEEVEIAEITPIIVEVTLESEAAKVVPVQVNRLGTLAPGFGIQTTEANPQEVEIAGASSVVQLVESAVADVNLTGLRSSIQQQYSLKARDATGADVPRIRIEPSSAVIRLAVEQEESTIVLPVRVETQGRVGDGFNLVSISTDPLTVTVTGPQEALQAVSALETEPVDLNSATSDLSRSVPLIIPTGLQALRDSVSVVVNIEPVRGTLVLAVAPEAVDVPENLTAAFQTTFLSVRLSGEMRMLTQLTANDLTATVSLEGLTAGVHVLDVNLIAPDGIQVISMEPAQTVVSLRP